MIELEQSTESQQNHSTLELGLARFKPSSLKVIQHLLDENSITHVLNKTNWRLKEKPFNLKWHLLFQQLHQVLCQRLFIEAMDCPTLLLSIEPCSFPNLTVLNLSHNPISSVESLSFLEAPNLQFIFLQTNHITCVKSLSKLHLKHLEELDLSNNKMQEASSLSRLKTEKKSKGFSVQLYTFDHSHHHHWHEDQNSCKIEGISLMAKIEHEVNNSKNDFRKKYEMIKRQFDYILTEINSSIRFMNTLTQQRTLKAIERKYCW